MFNHNASFFSEISFAPLAGILGLELRPDPLTQRLVRFLARDGRTYYGDAILPAGVTDIAKTRQARVIKGDIFGKHDVTDQVAVTILMPWSLKIDF